MIITTSHCGVFFSDTIWMQSFNLPCNTVVSAWTQSGRPSLAIWILDWTVTNRSAYFRRNSCRASILLRDMFLKHDLAQVLSGKCWSVGTRNDFCGKILASLGFILHDYNWGFLFLRALGISVSVGPAAHKVLHIKRTTLQSEGGTAAQRADVAFEEVWHFHIAFWSRQFGVVGS